MQVYTLPDSAPAKVLLTGDLDFVMEFADLLSKRSVPFRIVPPMDELDELELELDFLPDDLSEASIDAAAYAPYADLVVSNVRSDAGSYSHIVDLGVASALERKATVEIASSVNPRATVIVSCLSNTATELGMLTGTATRIVGVGLAPSMINTSTTIDLAGGLNTREEHVQHAVSFLRTLGYEPTIVEDRLALVQLRVLATLINEAAFAVMEGVASPEDIDAAMKLGVNYPKGLLAWADEIGIPIVTIILDSLYREYQQERYRPCVLLKQYMRAGWHGKAVGRGFYTY